MLYFLFSPLPWEGRSWERKGHEDWLDLLDEKMVKVTSPAGPAPRMNVLSLSRSCWYSWYNTTVVKLWFPSTFDEFLDLWFWFCLFPLLLISMLMGASWYQDPSNTSQPESLFYLRKIIFLAGYQQAMFHIYQLGNSR